MHLITSRLCGVSGRLSKTADCQFTKEPRQPGSAEGPRSSRRASAARLRHFGYPASWCPDPSPPGPEPTRTATETRRPAAQRRRFRTARSGQGCLFDLSLCSPSPLHTHTDRAAGAEFIFPGVGTLPQGGGRRYRAAGRPGAGMLIEMELEARPQIRGSEYRRGRPLPGAPESSPKPPGSRMAPQRSPACPRPRTHPLPGSRERSVLLPSRREGPHALQPVAGVEGRVQPQRSGSETRTVSTPKGGCGEMTKRS